MNAKPLGSRDPVDSLKRETIRVGTAVHLPGKLKGANLGPHWLRRQDLRVRVTSLESIRGETRHD